jgi:hypothetical protein
VKLEDLRKSASQMTDDELLAEGNSMRGRRRMPLERKTAAKPIKTKYSREELLDILDLLGDEEEPTDD